MIDWKSVTCATSLVVLPAFAQAAIVDAGSYVPNATGNALFETTQERPRTQFFDSQADGTLDSVSVWFSTASTAMEIGKDFTASLFGRDDGGTDFFFGPDFTLASETFSYRQLNPIDMFDADADASPDIKFTWDLSVFNISAEVGQRFGLRIAPESEGDLLIHGNTCQNPGPNCPFPVELDLTLFNGTPDAIGSGSGSQAWGYALTVDDGTGVAPVPLPAGLPLLLAGLGAFGLIRSRQKS